MKREKVNIRRQNWNRVLNLKLLRRKIIIESRRVESNTLRSYALSFFSSSFFFFFDKTRYLRVTCRKIENVNVHEAWKIFLIN